jgi:deoxyhypusine synthase
MKKKDLLNKKIDHIDIKAINSVDIIKAMKKMSFSARDLANAADIYDRMLKEKNCAVILTLAGSTSAAGCMQVYVDMVENNMVDAIVATGASIVDMDFFEALGFKHYQGTPYDHPGVPAGAEQGRNPPNYPCGLRRDTGP